jgi:hypothetical protein
MQEEKQDNAGETIKCPDNKEAVRVFADDLTQPDCNSYCNDKKEHKENEDGNCP